MAKAQGPGLLDRKILDLFANGATPEEVEAETYVPALTALARARELLASADLWDEMEQRRLLAHSLKGIKQQVENNFDPTDAKILQSYTNLVGTIDKIQDKQRAISDEELKKLAMTQAEMMLRMIEMSFTRVRQLLSEEYPEVDLGRIDTLFFDDLRTNSKQIEAP